MNSEFLRWSRGWHPPDDELFWTVLSFSPEILSHDGVRFTTTNNVYHDVIARAPGPEGLEAMFAPRIPWGYKGSVIDRPASQPSNEPTDVQAEVLYPGRVPLEYLQSISVLEHEHSDSVHGMMTSLRSPYRVPVLVRPEVFR